MNKKFLLTLTIPLLIAGLLLSASSALAGLEKTPFSAVEKCTPTPIIGEVRLVGSRVVMPGLVQYCNVTADDPRVSGTEVLNFFANFDADSFSGQFHGTMTITNEGGWWVATFAMRLNPDGMLTSLSQGPFIGYGGYKGLMLRIVEEAHEPGTDIWTMSGYIVHTGASK
jgi:hypothetical protein